jgi:hypothetical protein
MTKRPRRIGIVYFTVSAADACKISLYNTNTLEPNSCSDHRYHAWRCLIYAPREIGPAVQLKKTHISAPTDHAQR